MLKTYHLPHGKLHVNRGKIDEVIYIGNQPITLLPGQSKFEGNIMGLDLRTYFLNPEFWDAKLKIQELLEEGKEAKIYINAKGVDRFGDHILLTVLPKAYKQTYGDEVKVDLAVSPGFEQIWQYNPDLHSLSISSEINPVLEKSDLSGYSVQIDVRNIEFKFKREKDDIQSCVDKILEAQKLSLVNKTPSYSVSKEEVFWAKQRLDKKKRPLIGIALYSKTKSRTYLRMRDVGRLLEKEGFTVVYLDEKRGSLTAIEKGFNYTFRQMAALANECDIIVCADSAMLHLAGALKKRIVGLFGHTEGNIMAEDYEKAIYIQGKCQKSPEPCWWELTCLKGDSYQEKEDKGYVGCLDEINPRAVVQKVMEHIERPRKILIAMLTYNLLDATKKAIDSIRTFHDADLFVVDNESEDGTKDWLKRKGIEFVSKRTSVAGAQNLVIQKFLQHKYEYLILLNNDLILRYDTIDRLIEGAEKSKAWAVMSSEVQNAPPWAIDKSKPVNYVVEEIVDIPAGSYSCTLFTRECIEKVGFFNERYEPRYIEDNDYTLRMRLKGGRFVKYNGAVYYHLLGGVLKTNKNEKAQHDESWNKNIGIFQEMYGLHPHEHQDLNRLGLEWKRGVTIDAIEAHTKNTSVTTVLVERRMGGYGDILFTSVVGRELKKHLGNKVQIFYRVPNEFEPLLMYNPNVDSVVSYEGRIATDFRIDLTDLEFRVELQEMQMYGEIRSARTEIYLKTLGWVGNTSFTPDYFVTEEEKIQAKNKWAAVEGKYKIAVVLKGSNKLKDWPGMEELASVLKKRGYGVLILDRKESNNYTNTFRQSAALVSCSDLVISPDSGISNLAGALDIPVITIFSNRNGENFTKMYNSMRAIQGHCPFQEKKNYCDFFVPCFGSGPHRSKENIDIPECLKRLKVEEVYEKIQELLLAKNNE